MMQLSLFSTKSTTFIDRSSPAAAITWLFLEIETERTVAELKYS